MPADPQQMQVERPMERDADGQFVNGRAGGVGDGRWLQIRCISSQTGGVGGGPAPA
jgi:hypothetical protein